MVLFAGASALSAGQKSRFIVSEFIWTYTEGRRNAARKTTQALVSMRSVGQKGALLRNRLRYGT